MYAEIASSSTSASSSCQDVTRTRADTANAPLSCARTKAGCRCTFHIRTWSAIVSRGDTPDKPCFQISAIVAECEFTGFLLQRFVATSRNRTRALAKEWPGVLCHNSGFNSRPRFAQKRSRAVTPIRFADGAHAHFSCVRGVPVHANEARGSNHACQLRQSKGAATLVSATASMSAATLVSATASMSVATLVSTASMSCCCCLTEECEAAWHRCTNYMRMMFPARHHGQAMRVMNDSAEFHSIEKISLGVSPTPIARAWRGVLWHPTSTASPRQNNSAVAILISQLYGDCLCSNPRYDGQSVRVEVVCRILCAALACQRNSGNSFNQSCRVLCDLFSGCFRQPGHPFFPLG